MCFSIIQISRGIQIVCIFQVKPASNATQKHFMGREKILWVIEVRFLKTRLYVPYTSCYNIICVLICTVTGHASTATVAQLQRFIEKRAENRFLVKTLCVS